MIFSDSSLNQGIVEQTRAMMRVDSSQWPTARIVASCNNWLDTITGYAIGADRTFQWDDTNHTALPEGTTNLSTTTADYAFLTDQQSNPILNLLGVSVLVNGYYEPLTPVNRNDPGYDVSTFGQLSGTPSSYDKIADNIIRLNVKSDTAVTAGLKFYFQRTGSYFVATDTTKSPGVAPLLHRGFVIASAYDGALTLGLSTLQALGLEMQREDAKMKQYFSERNTDVEASLTPACEEFE